MLDKDGLLQRFERLGTPDRGRSLVLNARTKSPVRNVVSKGGNVITVYFSQKMQKEIRTESRNIEFQAALRYEHDEHVLEYYPQPCELKLVIEDELTGETHSIQHFPDYLLIRDDRIELAEWKTTARLERLVQKSPWRYQRDEDGRWYAPGIERQLAEFGITYRIYSDADLNPLWSENMLALVDYLHPAAEPCPSGELSRLKSALLAEPSLYLADLYAEPYGFKADHVLKAIADQILVADLEHEDLTQPRRARLYRDEAVRDLLAGYQSDSPPNPSFQLPIATGVAFVFDGRRYVMSLVGKKDVVLSDEEGRQTEVPHSWLHERHDEGRLAVDTETLPRPQEPISHYSEEELRIALGRLRILEGASSERSDRTLRRWRTRQLAAQINGNNEALALVPRTRDRGNRTRRLGDEQEALMERVIHKHWLNNRAPNYKSCHRYLLKAFDSAGLVAPSYPTLIERIKAHDHTRSNWVRHGKRRAYQEGEFVPILSYDTPVHGSRPFQYCHIDHTLLDIELIDSRTGQNLGRPWFSMAIDSFTRRILGIYLSYDAPSYASTMMVIRDIVRRHQRMPQFLVVDNGADFRSGNLVQLLEVMGTHLRSRPSGQPRFGSVLERLFGRVNTEYVHNLAGNTKATKQVRMTTGKFLPNKLAEWSLEAMYFGLQHWAFEYYDQCTHPALNMSPGAFYEKTLAETGARSHLHLTCNRDFLIATCPAVDKGGTRKIDRQRGVKVDDFYYWAAEFSDLKIAGTTVPVRFDPWDASSVYALVNKQWIRCRSKTLARLGWLSEAERKLLSEEFKARRKVKPDAKTSMQVLTEFLQTFTPKEVMALEIARCQQNKALYHGLGQTFIEPPDTMHPFFAKAHESTPDLPGHAPASVLHDSALPEFDTF